MRSPLAADTLIAARRASGLYQKEVARLAHTTQSAISRIETGHVDPTVGTLERILAAIGCEMTINTRRT